MNKIIKLSGQNYFISTRTELRALIDAGFPIFPNVDDPNRYHTPICQKLIDFKNTRAQPGYKFVW